MPSTQNLVAYWYFHGPSLLLAGFALLLVVRLAVEIVTLGRAPRAMRAASEVAMAPVRRMVPSLTPEPLVIAMAIAWLMAARLLWYLACTAAGMRLSLTG